MSQIPELQHPPNCSERGHGGGDGSEHWGPPQDTAPLPSLSLIIQDDTTVTEKVI